MFVFYKYLYSVFICYIMIIPSCFTKVLKLCPLNPMYYKFYCNIFQWRTQEFFSGGFNKCS
jgi:hypothetical protein